MASNLVRNNVAEPVRFTYLKRLVSLVICSDIAGMLIGKLFNNLIPSHGMKFDTRIGVESWVKAYIFWGMYESAEVRFINSLLSDDSDVVELGSSIGVVSCHIAKNMSADNKLLLVEANPKLRSHIRSNLLQNKFSKRNVDIISAAIAYEEETTTAGKIEFHFGSSNLDSSKESNLAGLDSQLIDIIGLSELLTKHQIENYSLVMDIEGAEIDILLNDLDSLRSCNQIIAELHEVSRKGVNYTVEAIIELLVNEAGYELVARRGPVCCFTKSRPSLLEKRDEQEK